MLSVDIPTRLQFDDALGITVCSRLLLMRHGDAVLITPTVRALTRLAPFSPGKVQHLFLAIRPHQHPTTSHYQTILTPQYARMSSRLCHDGWARCGFPAPSSRRSLTCTAR